MATPATPRMQCPACGAAAHHSRRQLEEWPYRLMGMYAWRCLACDKRFHARPRKTKPMLRWRPPRLRIRVKLLQISAHLRQITDLLRIRAKPRHMSRKKQSSSDNGVPPLT